MTIDTQPGDTFTVYPSGTLVQYRERKSRVVSSTDWRSAQREGKETNIDPALARQIITAAGHTITETTPPAAPVPCPTHAVVRRGGTETGYRGTEAECLNEVKACWGEHYEVRPLAPAPLSPAMRAFIKWFTDAGYPTELRNLARNLLAEGGAK